MNRSFLTAFAALFCALLTIPQAQSKSRKPVPHKTAATTSRSRKGGRTIRSSGKTRHTRRGKHATSKAAPSATWRNRQLAPSSDRYREIQGALASKGYLKATPNGSWDAESQDAMKRFQADQHIDGTGKLNSRSLIALGLGPAKTSEAPAVTNPSEPKP